MRLRVAGRTSFSIRATSASNLSTLPASGTYARGRYRSGVQISTSAACLADDGAV